MIGIVYGLFLALQAGAAQSGAPGAVSAASDPLSIGRQFAKGEVGLSALKRLSVISGRVLAQDKTASVYAGFRDPIFQAVLWGVDKEKPDRVLIEFDPRRQTMETLNGFNTDWNTPFSAASAKSGTLDNFGGDTPAHLKAYCEKLPPGAHCEVRIWETDAGRILRADIHLSQGPPVPKAVEFDRRSAKPASP